MNLSKPCFKSHNQNVNSAVGDLNSGFPCQVQFIIIAFLLSRHGNSKSRSKVGLFHAMNQIELPRFTFGMNLDLHKSLFLIYISGGEGRLSSRICPLSNKHLFPHRSAEFLVVLCILSREKWNMSEGGTYLVSHVLAP